MTKKIFDEELKDSMHCFELETEFDENGEVLGGEIVYFEFNEEKNAIEYGSVCNVGLCVKGCMQYDDDFSILRNLENLYTCLKEKVLNNEY